MSGNSFHAGDNTKTDLCNTQLRAAHALTNTESSTAPSFGKPISGIRFYSQVPRVCDEGKLTAYHERCEFALGLGPCGLYVTALTLELTKDFLTIIQETHAPFPAMGYGVKKFIYLVREILGRVEVTSV